MSTNALSAEYTRVIPAKFTTKRDGSPMACMTCGSPLVMGQAFAATQGNGWHSYCARCADSTVAQIAGLIARIEVIVGDLSPIPQNVLDAVAAVQPSVEAILAPKANPTTVQFLTAKGDLLVIRTLIGQAKAANQPAPVRSNAYGGKCGKCEVFVAPQTGRIEKINGRWVTFHLDGQCPTPQAAAPVVDVALGLYLHDDGTVRKVYTTQNNRQGVKVLVIVEAGVNLDGTPKMRGSFQYVPGGIRVVREAVAAGTAHLLTQDEAAAFGQRYSFCVNCGLYLDDDRSLAAGYGPKCASNNNWFYPTYTEAAAILGRPAGPANTHKATNPRFEAQVEADPTGVCEYCDETVTLKPLLNTITDDFSLTDQWVDSTGSEVCSGEDASGPDFHHKVVTS